MEPRNPTTVSYLLPLWVIAAQRFLLRRRAPQSTVVERSQFKNQLITLEMVRDTTPEPTTWLERLLYNAVTGYLDEQIEMISKLIDLKVSFYAVMPAGDLQVEDGRVVFPEDK